MKIEGAVLTVACCLLVLMTALSVSLYINAGLINGQRARELKLLQTRTQQVNLLQTRINNRNQQIQSFISELQQCKNISEVDKVLEGIGTKRVIED